MGAADAFKTRGVFGVNEIYRLTKGTSSHFKLFYYPHFPTKVLEKAAQVEISTYPLFSSNGITRYASHAQLCRCSALLLRQQLRR